MIKNHYTAAVIGAGPTGATCAYELASAGVDVVLFDHKAPWEKPCGGMIPARVFDEFPVIREYPYPKTRYDEMRFISPKNDIDDKKLDDKITPSMPVLEPEVHLIYDYTTRKGEG